MDLFKVGDTVLASPQVTGKDEWIKTTITDLEDNPFNGLVITVITDEGLYFFERADMFKKDDVLCTQ